MSSTLDGTNDDTLWNDCKERRLSMKSTEGTDCEGGHSTDTEDDESDTDW